MLHLLRYDEDRALVWHDLTQETWRGLGAQTANTLAQVMLTDAIAEITALRKRRKEQQGVQRWQAMQQLLQPDSI